MKILYIHEVNYRQKVIFEMHEFPELLSLRSNEVDFFEYPEDNNHGAQLRTSEIQITGRVYPNARINLITPTNFGVKKWERYIAPIFAFFSLRKTLREKKYDVIVLLAVPTSGWQATYFAKKYKVPIVFRALDVSHKIRKNILSSLIKQCEKFIYRNVTILSANTPSMESYCVSLSGRKMPTVVNLPPVDLSHFTNSSRKITREDLGLNSQNQVLLYMGTFFTFSGLEQVIENFSSALDSNNQLRLVLVGGGELDEVLRNKVKKLNLEKYVIFTGVVPYAELPGYLQLANVAINPFEKELLTDVALPHKVLQYMAAGIPVLSTSLEGLRSVLGDKSGVTWCQGPDQVIPKALELLSSTNQKQNQIRTLQKNRVHELFNIDQVTNSMEETIRAAVELTRSRGTTHIK